MKPSFIIITSLVALSIFSAEAQNNNRPYIDSVKYKIIKVRPSETNTAIHAWDTVHIVYYDPQVKNNKILLWLTGTNGTTKNVPAAFFNTALEQGYKVVSLSFISMPAVAQVCVGTTLNGFSDCAAEFRRKRIYGDNNFSLINDEPQDAIIPRFVKLLQWLVKHDAAGNWQQYLDASFTKPVWNKIAIAGQSQGGGMAQFIGKQETLARVISFSGGWDYADSKEKKIAGWYFNKNATALDNCYATYHIHEMAAIQLAEICTALQLPTGHVFALDKPLMSETNTVRNSPNPYHGEGIRNITYRPIWITMLGSGF